MGTPEKEAFETVSSVAAFEMIYHISYDNDLPLMIPNYFMGFRGGRETFFSLHRLAPARIHLSF